MRLLKIHKDSFVHAVMADVPQIDYDEAARNALLPVLYASLPEATRAYLASDASKIPGLELDRNFISMPRGLSGVHAVRPKGWKCPEVLWAELEKLGADYIEQVKKRNAMESRLEAMISSCTTLKSAQARFPDLVKYLPTEDAPSSRLVPATTDLMDNLRSLGFKG